MRPRPHQPISGTRWPRVALPGLLLLLASGCMPSELPTYYGRHEAPAAAASVNGTDVLAGMFREAGRDVRFRRLLVTSELQKTDTIVWFPDDYHAPSEEVCEWFDDWLADAPNRTLVFVGRYFDAAPLYWKRMTPRVGKGQQQAYRLREIQAQGRATPPADLQPEELACEWFRYQPGEAHDVQTLAGPWAVDIDAGHTGIQLGTTIEPSRPGRKLLMGRGDALVEELSESYWPDSRLLLVANGSFLLNLPLVDHPNRELAARLIATTAPDGRVVFLESGSDGPPIDPPGIDNSLWTLFAAWPLGVILLQLAAAGVIFCFARWPVFGRPKQPPVESTSDFGLHVAAVGALLARTGDRQFAAQRVPAAEPGAAAAAATSSDSPAARFASPTRTSKGN